MNHPQPTPWLADFLKSIEKFRPTAYKPTAKDVWTIGYGHTHSVKEGDTCTMAQALDWLKSDTAGDYMALVRHVTVPLTPPQVDALCSLVHNIGETQFAGSTMLRDLNAGDYAGAAAEFPRWDRQAGNVLAGLLTRREAEQKRFQEST